MVTFSSEQLQGIVKERLGCNDQTHYLGAYLGCQGGAGGAAVCARRQASTGLAPRASCGTGVWETPSSLIPTLHCAPYTLLLPTHRTEFSDLEKSVRDDVKLLQESPLVKPGTPIK